MCQRLNYEILIARAYVRHDVIMYVIIINVIINMHVIIIKEIITS